MVDAIEKYSLVVQQEQHLSTVVAPAPHTGATESSIKITYSKLKAHICLYRFQ